MGAVVQTQIFEIAVTLVDKDKRNVSTDAFSEMIRNEIGKIPGAKVIIQPTSITGSSEAPTFK
ncbi:MAG: hypothetical protein R2822_09235 [Spirosomataceae bacterium]